MAMTYDVRVWAVKTYERAGGRRTYGVRWIAGGEAHSRTFTTRALADGFRSELMTAARQGHPFDLTTGLPPSLTEHSAAVTWYEHVLSFVDMKWQRAAPRSRQSTADALASVTAALLPTGRGRPEPRVLRASLYGWAFNPPRRTAGPPDTDDLAAAAKWAERNSPLLTVLNERAVARRVLDSLTVRMDGQPAAANTIGRRRAVLYNALEYAVELDRLPSNPLTRVKWKAPKVAELVDVRTVVNHDQARALLAAVERQSGSGSALAAFFGCIYYSATRPAEAAELRESDIVWPVGEGSGELRLNASNPTTALSWTDNGRREPRQLKHRGRKEVRVVPCPPPLVQLLRRHLAEHGTTPDGRLFRGERGGPISDSVYGRFWERARTAALTPAEAASPLADRPYALRHAAVSTWLNAGVDPSLVAEWAGHSVHVLLRVYAKCVSGREVAARERVAQHLACG
jgi:integrase